MEDNQKIEECTEACEENKCKKGSKKPSSKELTAEIESLKSSLAELNDKYLRMAAEYDNFRRRSREEREAVYEVAVSDTVAEILPIIDNLERAVAFDAEASVKEGLSMIMKSVDAAFAKLGVEPVGAAGDIFDPNLHNAVLHGEDPDKADGEIVEVYQRGYKKGKKMIRFAMVKTVN